MSYVYKPLLNPDTEIRIAVLQPGYPDDDLKISFRRRVLDEKTPAFEALSYVWGQPGKQCFVQVVEGTQDQGTIPITENLDIALRHLRSMEEERALYIDALSIRQTDMSKDGEKSKQVAIMGKIYYLSNQTVVWLGPRAEDSDNALKRLQYFASQLRTDEVTNRLLPTEECVDPSLADPNILLPYKSGELNSVHSLLNRPYFTRTWVRQEVTLAQKAIVQCGRQQIPWPDFVQGVAVLSHKRHETEAVDQNREFDFQKAATRALDLCRLTNLGCEYTNLRLIFSDTECTDLRDKIYGVLKLVPERDQRLGVKPNYELSPEEVYIDLAKRIIINDNRTRLLEACEHESRNLKTLPTWVPDWSTTMNIARAHHASAWSASAWLSATATVTKSNILRVPGIYIARIESVIDNDLSKFETERQDVLNFLQSLGASDVIQDAIREQGKEVIRKYCAVLVGALFAQSFHPDHPDKPDFRVCARFLEVMWTREIDDVMELFTEEMVRNKTLLFDYCRLGLVGRCFFHASDGYIGLAPKGSRAGDVITVVLGCKWPIVLRPTSDAKSTSYEVIGACYTEGLMAGEAIYRGKLPSHYEPVVPLQAKSEDAIDGYSNALYDTETRTIRTNPAEILEEMGIKVEKYQKAPHVLRVPLETLRAAGIPLRVFSLV